MDPKIGLNKPQKEAILHIEGPLLIIAGAGAGKTKTITHRIAHLIIDEGIPAERILALTFTNKAAGEMRDRIRTLIPSGRGTPLVATFHSLGVRILREFSGRAGVPRNFTIWDRDDSLRAIKRILGVENDTTQPRVVLSRISREKGQGTTPDEFEARARNFRERDIARVWPLYEKALAEEGALDFDDLLSRTLLLLRRDPEVLALLQDRWTHITIDEYQDTNASQMEIARLLCGEKKNICVVGDIDQNIYSWRGADIEHLMQFERTFAPAKVVTLEQNYRSTRTILAAANSIIEKNLRRKPKILFTENTTGEPLSFYGAHNEVDEAWFVATKAQELVEKGTRPSEIAVLYRENFQSRALEEAFLHFGLPYRVVGTRFFERKEVKDILSYLRAAWNPKSKIDIARAAGTPSRGIGKVTLEKMCTPLENRSADLPAEASAQAGGTSTTAWGGFSLMGLAGSARTKAEKFIAILAHIRKAIETLPASDAVRYATEVSGMEKMYTDDPALSGERAGRLENIHELVNVATKYDFVQPPQGIEQLLEEAALQSDQDELSEEMEATSLMTVHASKGLEFDAVFITGLEQGLFPSRHGDTSTSLSTGDSRDPEEERRLMYVALTRARKRLFLSYARERMKYGSREHTLPSEFLQDIDPRLMHYARPESETSESIIT